MVKKRDDDRDFVLNGLSIHSLNLNQEGDLEVEFDLPCAQATAQYDSQLRGIRTLNVYEDPELKEACRRLFDIVRRHVRQPDPERLKVHCDRCASSGCCRNYNVLVTPEDMERLARRLDLAPEDFRARFTTPAVDWSADYERQLACDHDEKGEEKCVFLKRAANGQFRCSVYEDRPKICRDFDMNRCEDFVPLESVASFRQTGRGTGTGTGTGTWTRTGMGTGTG